MIGNFNKSLSPAVIFYIVNQKLIKKETANFVSKVSKSVSKFIQQTLSPKKTAVSVVSVSAYNASQLNL